MRERAEQCLVEQFITQAADEELSEGVLHRLAWRDVMPGGLVIVCPSQNGVRGELGALAHDHPGLAALAEEPVEFAGDPEAGD